MLIAKGAAECVILSHAHNLAHGGQHRRLSEFHPCGANISMGVSSDDKLATERVPINTVLGYGSILGLSNFLSAPQTMHFRARTDVTVYMLKTLPPPPPSPATPAPAALGAGGGGGAAAALEHVDIFPRSPDTDTGSLRHGSRHKNLAGDSDK